MYLHTSVIYIIQIFFTFSHLEFNPGTNKFYKMILLSPAKTLDFESLAKTRVCTQPEFLEFSKDLIQGLSKLSSDEVGKLMSISPKLADLNKERFQKWALKHDQENAKQAVLAFKGDVYEGLRAWDFTKSDFTYAQKRLRCLLYTSPSPRDEQSSRMPSSA